MNAPPLGNGKRTAVSCQLRPDTIKRLDELAAESGMKRAAIISALLEELLPTVQGVRMRLQVTRKETGRDR